MKKRLIFSGIFAVALVFGLILTGCEEFFDGFAGYELSSNSISVAKGGTVRLYLKFKNKRVETSWSADFDEYYKPTSSSTYLEAGYSSPPSPCAHYTLHVGTNERSPSLKINATGETSITLTVYSSSP
jgi:hypothetical protein